MARAVEGKLSAGRELFIGKHLGSVGEGLPIACADWRRYSANGKESCDKPGHL